MLIGQKRSIQKQKKCVECGFEFDGEVCDVCYDEPERGERNEYPEQSGQWEEDEYGVYRRVWK